MKYLDAPDARVTKAAFTFTFDAGCEYGGGVSCGGGTAEEPSQTFLGFMAYHRLWFARDTLALTVGGGAISNPGRYLVLVPPVNGATAASGTPYFTASPGDEYTAWDASLTLRLHAEPVRDVPARGQSPGRQRAVLRGRGGRDAARRQHGGAGFGGAGLQRRT